MSDEPGDTEGSNRGLFRRHWKAVALVTGTSMVSMVAMLFAAIGWYDPSILGVLLSPVMLIVWIFAGLTLLLGAVAYIYTDTGSVTTFIRRSSPDATDQLSAYDARKLAEWVVYHEEHVLVGSTDDSGVVPVTTPDEGVTTRIFEWRFTEKHSTNTYVFLIDIEQQVPFDPEWVTDRTPTAHEQMDTAVRSLQNTRLLKNPTEDDIDDAREALGNSVRNQEIVEELDEDGNVTKQIKRDRTVRTHGSTDTGSGTAS
jgi:hypothetical protein